MLNQFNWALEFDPEIKIINKVGYNLHMTVMESQEYKINILNNNLKLKCLKIFINLYIYINTKHRFL